MALGSLFLAFIIMSIIAIVGVILLFVVKKENANDIILVLLAAFAMTIAYLSANAQPINFINQQILAWCIGALSLAGVGARFISKKQLLASKILVAVSIIGGMYFLYFG